MNRFHKAILYATIILVCATELNGQPIRYTETHQDIIKAFRVIGRQINNLEAFLDSRIADYCTWTSIPSKNIQPRADIMFQNDLVRWCVCRMMRFTSYMPVIDCWRIYKKNGVGSDLDQEVTILKEFCIVLKAIYITFIDELNGTSTKLTPNKHLINIYKTNINKPLPRLMNSLSCSFNLLQSTLRSRNLAGRASLIKRLALWAYHHPISLSVCLILAHRIFLKKNRLS